ncbi:luciferase-like domain-containing protein [Aspergillus venezuelensis]
MADTNSTKKQWILNGFTMSTPGHLAPGLWRHPRNKSTKYNTLTYWTNLAQILERGKIHSFFIVDVLGPYDVYKGPHNFNPGLASASQIPMADPFLAISAMAAVTSKLSFGITASTTYENPYLLARRFGTLDALTNRRVAWNAVTRHLESAARNVGLTTQIEHDERYSMADEYLSLTKYFRSAGPLTTPPTRQRTPFIFQAGTSTAGKTFATKHAGCMFLAGMDPATVRRSVDDIKSCAAAQRRDPNSIKTVAGIFIVVDETDEKAQQKYEDYLSLDGDGSLYSQRRRRFPLYGAEGDTEPCFFVKQDCSWEWGLKWTKTRVAQEVALGGPHARAIGSASTVADILENWVEESGVDGFNLSYAVAPAVFEDIVTFLVPELQRRGVFWTEYAAATTRENFLNDGLGPRLRDDHPGSVLKWAAED